MNRVTESVRSFRKCEEIAFEQAEDIGVFRFEFPGESARVGIAELLARNNHRILLGSVDR